MIIVKDLQKLFIQGEDFYALRDINFVVRDGECVVLKGVSGSGKSTLLSIIAAILKPTSGSVEVDGENIVSLSDYHLSRYRNKSVGYVTQSFHLFEELSVEENMLPPLVINSYSSTEIKLKIKTVLEICNISHKAKQKVTTLSGGEKQRCVIARALVNNPNLILCDEPTANLDKQNSFKFMQIIKKLKSMGKTIIIATHDPLFENFNEIDRVINIKEGTLE